MQVKARMYVHVDGEETTMPILNKQPNGFAKWPRFGSCCDCLKNVFDRCNKLDLVFSYVELGDTIDMSPDMDIHVANTSLMSLSMIFIPYCFQQAKTRDLARNFTHTKTEEKREQMS